MLQERAVLVWNGLLDLVYPPCCLVCGAGLREGALCTACREDFQPLLPPFCDRCGGMVPAGALICESCAAGPEPPFDGSFALGVYARTLRRAIHRLKYDGKTALAAPLGHLLAEALSRSPSPLFSPGRSSETTAFDLVVPVPLHPSRLRQRGFNQAERIARVIAQECGWQLDTQGLRRIRRTRTQTALTPSERAANMKGAFAVRETHRFAGKSVLLVDDVLTTTATVQEAAKVIREAGARRVCVVALARSA